MPIREEYTILDELGQGGFATVYKARHKKLGYIRAMRVLNSQILRGESDTIYQKFLEECKILLRLGNGNNSNIVHIYQPRLIGSTALVEMDFVDGKDIYHYLEDNSSFVESTEVIRLLKDIGSALAYCHEDVYKFCMDKDEDDLPDDPNDRVKPFVSAKDRQRLINKYRVIHNDIHSGNIIRREDGSYILLDFGLAIEGDNVIRSSKRRNGAPEFKAPEKWDNDGLLSTESDIYSFGVVLYELLAGQVPFPFDKTMPNSTEAEYLVSKAHKLQVPQAIYELRKNAFNSINPDTEYQKDYPDWLETVILKCLSKDPKKRYKNGKELFIDVHNYLTNDNTDHNSVALKTENFQLKKELEVLNGKINNANKAVDDFVSDLQRQIKEANTNKDKLTSQVADLQNENHSLKEQLEDISSKAGAEEQKVIVSLQEKLNESEAKILSITRQLDSVIAERNRLKEENTKLIKQKQSSSNKLWVSVSAILATTIVVMLIVYNNTPHTPPINDSFTSTVNIDEKSSQEIKTLTKSVNQLTVERDKLQSELQTLKSNSSTQISKEINALNAEISRLKSANSNMVDKSEVTKKEQEINRLKGVITENEKLITENKRLIKVLEDQLEI